MYHYAGNNPIKYIDPDGRSDIVEIAIDITETWIDTSPREKKIPYVSLFTSGFLMEYDQTVTRSKYTDTFDIVFSGIICSVPGGYVVSIIYEITALCKTSYLKITSSPNLVGEKPFSYLRTAEREMKRLEYLIENTSDEKYKTFLLEQKGLLTQEYKRNKLNIYRSNIPCLDVINEDYESFFTNNIKVIDYLGFDNEGKILPEKMIDYLTAYEDYQKVLGQY